MVTQEPGDLQMKEKGKKSLRFERSLNLLSGLVLSLSSPSLSFLTYQELVFRIEFSDAPITQVFL